MTVREIAAHRDAPTPQRAFVALFDVLGFRERLRRQPLRVVLDDYRRLQLAKTESGAISVFTGRELQHWNVGTTVFSDTILLWADDDWEAAQSLISACAHLLAAATDMGMPLRGGVAYGECALDRVSRTFVGQPIVDAYLTEQAQNWVGAALHPSVTGHVSLGTSIRKLEEVLAYPVPVKRGSAPLEYAIHWCPYSHQGLQQINSLARDAGSCSVRRKYAATRRYCRRACEGYAVLGDLQ